jgi:hypothetical protein
VPLVLSRGQNRSRSVRLGNDFLDAHDGNVQLGEGRRQAGVAFVFGHGNGAGVGYDEVGTRHADFGGGVLVAQQVAGRKHQGLGVVGAFGAQVLDEDVVDVGFAQVHGRRHDVVGALPVQLHDELAQVGFDRLHAVLLQVLVEVDFLGGHALGLHHSAGVAGFHQLADFSQGLGRVACPESRARRAP